VKGAQKKERLPEWIKQKHREREELKRRLQDDDARRKRALAKEAKAAQRKEYREERVKLRALAKDFCSGPRPRSKVIRSEAELLKLGGKKEEIQRKDGPQEQIIFGPVGETRFIYTPWDGGWMVALDAKPSSLGEELKRELNRSRRNLWNVPKLEQQPATEQKPAVAEDKQREGLDLAVHAVDALLSCKESFKGLPSNKQQGKEVQWAIYATLEALKRDGTKGRKLQVAYEWLTGEGSPSQIVKLRHLALMLAVKLQRPPSKKELKDRFDSTLPPDHPIHESEFSKRLKEAGLSWLKRGQPDRLLESLRKPR
jgi:hypothetical protein